MVLKFAIIIVNRLSNGKSMSSNLAVCLSQIKNVRISKTLFQECFLICIFMNIYENLIKIGETYWIN